MADELLLDHDPVSGMKEWISTDEETGEVFVRYEQDVSPILDYNKEMQADSFDKRSEMWHAAKIPNVVAMEWMTKYGVQMWNPAHKDGVRKLLNSNEYRYLRVNHFML